MPGKRNPSNRLIANLTGLAAFAGTLAVLGLAGFAVAMLDPDPGGEGASPLLAILVLLAASAAVGIAARFLAYFVLKRARPGGV